MFDRANPYELVLPIITMKSYTVTVTTEERFIVDAASEDEAMNKLEGLEPDSIDIVDTSAEERI